MIKLCRNFISRSIFWVFLPYFILGLGAPFLHTHVAEDTAYYHELAEVAKSGVESLSVPGGGGLAHIPNTPIHSHRHDQCVICTWINSNISSPPSVNSFTVTPVITPFVEASVVEHHYDLLPPSSSRAPPQA